jgi:2-octaprenyl-6-methoxyphenol hydroxylase
MSSPLDVAINGGGPVGLTLGLALRANGFSVALVDAESPQPSTPGGRAFFVAYGCWRIWRALGLEPKLAIHAQPVTGVEATGEARGQGIGFHSEDCPSETALGYMVEQNRLVPALREAALAAGVRILAPARATDVRVSAGRAELSAGAETLSASLVAGCDGAGSQTREAAGIRFEGWDYPAKALSATLKLAKPHEGVARQLFLRHGPLALLPLPEGRANLVWTERAAAADALAGMTEEDFAAELRHAAGAFVGAFELAGPRHAFPVGLKVAERFHAPRIALAGDSAHLIHPLAGQGLNLGLKDAAALVDVVADAARVGLDIGAEASLAPYTRWRRADVVASASVMEAFARAFSGPAPVRFAASLAMQAAGAAQPLRKLFAREAGGDLGELPTLMRA